MFINEKAIRALIEKFDVDPTVIKELEIFKAEYLTPDCYVFAGSHEVRAGDDAGDVREHASAAAEVVNIPAMLLKYSAYACKIKL